MCLVFLQIKLQTFRTLYDRYFGKDMLIWDSSVNEVKMLRWNLSTFRMNSLFSVFASFKKNILRLVIQHSSDIIEILLIDLNTSKILHYAFQINFSPAFFSSRTFCSFCNPPPSSSFRNHTTLVMLHQH